MLLPLELFDLRGPAQEAAVARVVLATDFLTQIAVREPRSKLIRVDEASARYLNNCAARGWSTSRFDTIDSNGGIENN